MNFILFLIDDFKYNPDIYLAAIIMIIFIIQLFIVFVKPKNKIKIVKAPTKKQIKRQKKKDRKLKKIKRRFKLPYRGKTQVIDYNENKYNEYIESIWDELKKH